MRPPDFGPLLAVTLLLIIVILAGDALRSWRRLTRIVGVGAALGPSALGVVDAQTVQVFAGFVDIDAGPLFEPDALR